MLSYVTCYYFKDDWNVFLSLREVYDTYFFIVDIAAASSFVGSQSMDARRPPSR
jgi:hypothetical protein